MSTEPSLKEMENLPWNYPGFVVGVGRYFDRMYFIQLPATMVPPWGADHNGVIWRYDNNPNEWYYTFRNRYYAGPNTSPHSGEDEKKWTIVKSQDVEKLRRLAGSIAAESAKFFNTQKPEENVIIIEGDHKKFGELLLGGHFDFVHVRKEELQ